jgi:hypothetical protein
MTKKNKRCRYCGSDKTKTQKTNAKCEVKRSKNITRIATKTKKKVICNVCKECLGRKQPKCKKCAGGEYWYYLRPSKKPIIRNTGIYTDKQIEKVIEAKAKYDAEKKFVIDNLTAFKFKSLIATSKNLSMSPPTFVKIFNKHHDEYQKLYNFTYYNHFASLEAEAERVEVERRKNNYRMTRAVEKEQIAQRNKSTPSIQ